MDQSAEMNTIELNEDNVSGTTTDVNNTETSDQEIESLLHDLNTTPENDAAAAALEKLRVSTQELTSTLTNVTRNIDSKYDVSTNAKQIDSKLVSSVYIIFTSLFFVPPRRLICSKCSIYLFCGIFDQGVSSTVNSTSKAISSFFSSGSRLKILALPATKLLEIIRIE